MEMSQDVSYDRQRCSAPFNGEALT